MESYITDTQCVEGIMALVTYCIVWYLYWDRMTTDWRYSRSAARWISVWIGRKFGTSLYTSYKKSNKIGDYKIMLFPKVGVSLI